MKENRLLFTNALIVLPTETINGSLAVEDGKITGIFESGTELPGFTEVDVHGKALMPGAIDTHVHMWDPSPLNYREDWACGSQCAASGGITTIIDMPLSVPPVVDKEGFQLKLDVAQKESCVDFAFWGGLTPNCVQNMEELNRLGCVAYKGFMSFANPDYPQVTDGYLVQGMRKAATFNGLIGVHAENAEVADFGSKEMSAIHCKDFAMHDDARPWWVEQEAISRAVLFARETGARLYICHMTIAQGAAFLKQAKFEGVNVSVETCPHYLLFDKTILRERGAYAKCNPPFRSRENVEKLWSYILDGTIDTLGSDHGPYRDDEKVQAGDFWKEYSGFGGFDAMLAAMLTEGYHRRGLSLSRLSCLTATNVEMVGNSFSIEYCNINVDGARDAVDDLAKKGVTVNLTYNASADSSQVDEQINILNQALAKQPNAILIAACDSGALDEQMITARDAGIPVIAYDITFDNAPEGSLTATSASDSILAAGQAADELLKNETVVEKIKAATPENPAVFSVIAPDAIMTVHRDRTSGFANRMYELCQEWQPGAVAITGNDAFAKDSEKDPAVIIRTDIAASRADEDIRNLAQSVVSDSSVLAIFCVNEASATGILSATSDGLDLDRTNGKYKDLIVIGFDSGSTLNNAVRSGYFYGAVAQDPYTMGYEAMMMAVNVLQGGEASDIVIPAVWFDASNMDDPEISRILYD